MTSQAGCATATLEDFGAWRPAVLLPSPGTHGPFEEDRFADLGPEVAGAAVPLGTFGGPEAALPRASCEERQTGVRGLLEANPDSGGCVAGDRQPIPSCRWQGNSAPLPHPVFKSSDELNSDQGVTT